MTHFLKDRFSDFSETKKNKSNGFYPYFKTFQSKQETEVTVNGKKVLMFGSNSYLSLTTHPKVMEAASSALSKFGSSCSGSRFLNGTTELHEELENRLAKFLGKEEVLVFSTGFQVNLGVIPCIAQKNDVILMDRLSHASIYEGSKLSEASKVIFRHNDMDSLEKRLQLLTANKHRVIIIDGVYSMEGDIAKLSEIVKLAKKYKASIMCDCAHAIGVLGNHGRGTPDHFGLTNEVELIGGTFSKSLASLGGYIAGDTETIQYIKHQSRSLIFSASMTPSSTAAALASLDIIEHDDSHRLKLWENTNYALAKFKSLGFDTGQSESPIIPIYIRNTEKAFQMTSLLFEEGVFVNPIVSPGVAPEDTLIRFSLMSAHSLEQIDTAIDKTLKIAKKLDLPLLSILDYC